MNPQIAALQFITRCLSTMPGPNQLQPCEQRFTPGSCPGRQWSAWPIITCSPPLCASIQARGLRLTGDTSQPDGKPLRRHPAHRDRACWSATAEISGALHESTVAAPSPAP